MTQEIEKILAQQEQSFDKNLLLEPDFFMTQKQKDCFETAKKLISKIALQQNFKEQFLLTSSDLKKIIFKPHTTAQILGEWRQHLFGEELTNLILNF